MVKPGGQAVQARVRLAGPPGEMEPTAHGVQASPSLPAGQMVCSHVPCTLLHTPLEPHVAYGEPWKPSKHVEVQMLPGGVVSRQLKVPLPGCVGAPLQPAHNEHRVSHGKPC